MTTDATTAIAMPARLDGVILLPTDGEKSGPPVDIEIENGAIAAIEPAATAACPAPARDARARQRARPCRPLFADFVRRRPQSRSRPGSCGLPPCRRSTPISARWRLRPRRARGRGFGDGALHALSWPDVACRGSARDRPGGGGRRRARDARRLHARPQSARLWDADAPCWTSSRPRRAGDDRGAVPLRRCPTRRSRSRASRRSPRRWRARPSRCSSARTARNGARTTCSARSRNGPRPRPAGASTCIFWRRAISARSPTSPIRRA